MNEPTVGFAGMPVRSGCEMPPPERVPARRALAINGEISARSRARNAPSSERPSEAPFAPPNAPVIGGTIDESGASTAEVLVALKVTGTVDEAVSELSNGTSAYSAADVPELKHSVARSDVVSVWISPSASCSVPEHVCTVIVVVSALPSLVAVTSLVPTATAVTSPVFDTVATAGVRLSHAIVRPVSVCPAESVVTALSCTVPATTSVDVGGETTTALTGGAATVIVAEPLLPSLLAKMVADPSVTPVTSPDDDTVAMFVAEELHCSARPVNTFPSASLITDVSCTVSAMFSEFVGGESCTDATATCVGPVESPPPPQERAKMHTSAAAGASEIRRARVGTKRMMPRRCEGVPRRATVPERAGYPVIETRSRGAGNIGGSSRACRAVGLSIA